jgi:hypothetical protein
VNWLPFRVWIFGTFPLHLGESFRVIIKLRATQFFGNLWKRPWLLVRLVQIMDDVLLVRGMSELFGTTFNEPPASNQPD